MFSWLQQLVRGSRQIEPLFEQSLQNQIYQAGVDGMLRVEAQYVLHSAELHLAVKPTGLYRARLFGALFPLHAYAALGPDHLKPANEVGQAYLKRAALGLFFIPWQKQALAHDIFQEQFNALRAESRSVGAGQYALGVLYLRVLEEALPVQKRKPMIWPENMPVLLGKVVSENLAVWASWHQKLSGRPMQAYTQGFTSGPRDAEPLGFGDDF